MARIFVTGSSTGLGLMAAELLIEQGHRVVLHARNEARAKELMAAAPGAEAVVVGDLASLRQTRALATQVNRLGRCDAVIHNAGVGYREPRLETEDGLEHIFAINVLAPYVLTLLIERPDRLVYLSSGMHHGVAPDFEDLLWRKRRWQGAGAYAESKFYDTVLASAVARHWPAVNANALEPGWVPTRMGGPGAPGDMAKAHLTQAWLAVSEDALARSSGEYFYHQALRAPNPLARDEATQENLLRECARLSGVPFKP
ncbi:MAG TPA: SDR family NAD(P)-dependent oxidoreductase [Hyphomicrobiaceae bacterium]|nr:SDR family NAD(P)-dependent oxidoreductase [Hyphomicrobiaceae bacterium]